jgi:(E)-4-hydroxy-3-methylbut-2-enyl-diphosphate synthase
MASKTVTLRGENIAEEFTAIVDRYVARTYQKKELHRAS